MIGESLGPYRIDRELGSGGMGKVYAATGPNGVVALKIVHPHLLEQPGFFKRFLREADIGKSVRHENVVRTLDCDQLVSSGQANAYLVMEYVEGQTLADLQRELDRIPEELCRHVAREICKGLAAIHAAGVVHRDLKPENVLITPDHVVKVMDLGVARLADEQMRLSQSGAFIGSVEYAAPEQFGGEVDHRSDLHALGVLLYEIASGVHPYRADTFPEVMKRIRDDAPRRLGELHPQLSPFFEEVVHTLLAKAAAERIASADELLAILEEGEESDWWHRRASVIRASTKRPLRRIRLPRETAVYGREDELAKLRTLYEKAKSGDGQVVLVEGEAGIGKSRLIDELIARLHADGEDLNFLFGSYPPGGASLAGGGFSSAYREQFGEAGSAPYLPDTPLLVPAFDAVLRGEPAPKGEQPLNASSLALCFAHVTRNLAAERPLIVLIDDLHFAPLEARRLFISLTLSVPGHRVLLVGTARPGVSEEWLANLTRQDHATQLTLPRLGAKDLVRLLQDSFSSERLAGELSAQIALKSDGNPFFVFEIVRGLREGQFITRRDDGSWVSTRVIDDIQIPSSVLDLIHARIASLSDVEKELLDVAACCGFEFDPGLVAEAVGLRRIPALRAFGSIEKSQRLVRSSGRRMVFDHHQVQEALYTGLLEQLREEYHAALGEALAARATATDQEVGTLDGGLCVDLCGHFLEGGRPDAAVRYLVRAQTHLNKGHLHEQCVQLGDLALAAPGGLRGAERIRALLRQAFSLESMGRMDAHRQAVEQAVELADRLGETGLRAHAHRRYGHFLERAHKNEAAIAELELAIALAREVGLRDVEADGRNCLSMVLKTCGRLDEAEAELLDQIRIRREIGGPGGEGLVLMNLGNVLKLQGRHEESKHHHERSLELSREAGDRWAESLALGALAMAYLYEGRLVEALELEERSTAMSREIGNRFGEVVGFVNLGPVWMALGEIARGRESLDRAIELCSEIGARYPESYGLMDLARLADLQGDAAEAIRLTEASVTLRRELEFPQGVAESLTQLGNLQRRGGDARAARASLVEALSLTRELGIDGQAALVQCELACLPGTEPDDALTAFAEHAEKLDVHRRREALLLLHEATGDRAHLNEVKRMLDDQLAMVPAEYHDSMCTNVRVNREIMAAWEQEFGEESDAPKGPPPGESPTRAG